MPTENKANSADFIVMESISKSFPGVKALDRVSLTLKRGEVHALMGENGAGKSTLMKCLFGVYKKDSGKIFLEGKEVEFSGAKDALDHGVAMVHQELNQALKLSVMDNMWLGRFPKISRFLPLTSEKKSYEMTKKIFDELKISTDPREKMSRLSVSKRQMVEIAKAVSCNAGLIVFDEPTSSLNDTEAEKLFEIIEMLKKRGCAIVYISHKMEEILRISDEVTIMRDGRHVATKPADELTTDEIIKLMVGREIKERYPEKQNDPRDIMLTVENLSGKYSRLSRASFNLRRGEILGIAGLDGSGRTELLETLFGVRRKSEGVIRLEGKEISNRTPIESIKNGFALLTEERRQSGIFGILSISHNATISSIKKYRTGPLLSDKKINSATDWCISSMRVKTPSNKVRIASLSGGNQQKIILGRWLLTKPKILLLDEPTRGIDVGAKYEIYKLIIELAKSDKGIIVVSSEMAELMGICDRIIVMSGGRVAGELDRKELTQEKIMQLASKFA
ncbi:MAG: ATP-binding cassette domain-containing protein [Ruminococcaceae bacterium]|nr:ATP-binding cassette domain-containing protein [Oscillospiraceae bacterium]